MQEMRLLEPLEGRPHVWVADLGALPLIIDCTILSVDERERAAQFRFEDHSRRFRMSRGVLRFLLGRYLCVCPEQIVFTYGANGKPQIEGSPIKFNISHADDISLIAFSQSPIGVDVERLRRITDCVEVADRFFSVDEARWLREESPRRLDAAFFRCWTRKEAVLKAMGVGLTFGLDRFSVSFDEPACVIRCDDDAREAAKWRLFHIEPSPGYIGALAASPLCGPPLIISLADFLTGA